MKAAEAALAAERSFLQAHETEIVVQAQTNEVNFAALAHSSEVHLAEMQSEAEAASGSEPWSTPSTPNVPLRFSASA